MTGSPARKSGAAAVPHLAASLASKRTLATWSLMIATAMQAADASIANVALPQLERDLGGGVLLGAWVMTSYLCATAVMAPLTGWLRRRYGARSLFPTAVGGFVAASLMCAAAPSGPTLILFRILQGAGAGLILPIAQAMLLDLYPEERHGRMLAMWGAATMTGPILAPLLGGIITDLISWRGVFAINLPLGILVILLVRGLPWQETETADRLPIDAVGIVLLVIGIGTLQLLLQRSVGQSWTHSPELAIEALTIVIAFVGLARRTRRSGFTLLRPEVFKDVNFAAAGFYNFTMSGLLFVTILFVPALGEGPLGYTATLAGFTIVPRAVLTMMMMLCIGRLIGRIDYRIMLSAGWLLMASGLLILSLLPPTEGQLLWIIIGSAVQAVGAGMLFTPHSTLAFSTLAPKLRTDAAGLYSLLRQLGCASGVALMTAVWHHLAAANLTHIAGGGGPAPAHLTDAAAFLAYCQCFRLMAIASLALMPGVLLFRVNRPEAGAKQAA